MLKSKSSSQCLFDLIYNSNAYIPVILLSLLITSVFFFMNITEVFRAEGISNYLPCPDLPATAFVYRGHAQEIVICERNVTWIVNNSIRLT